MIPAEHFEDGGFCQGCGKQLYYKVLKSNAGWYIGTDCLDESCSEFGPNSRETIYYKTESEANVDLKYYNETGNLKNERL